MKCNICGGEMQFLEVLQGQESEVTKLYKEPNYSKGVDISVYQCPKCTHGHINKLIQKDYYQKYELIHNIDDTGVQGNYTKSLLDYYEQQFEELNQYISSNECILDIGCGPGILLKKVMKYFQKGIGVESSSIQTKYAEENLDINVLTSFFDESVDIPDNSIDAFICTQVFEHLENVQEVTKTAFSKLKKNGIGYVEVPNGQKIINENRYYDIFPEHVNYYTVLSLSTLLVNAGFEIIKIGESFNGNFLTAYVRKGEIHVGFTKMREKYMEYIDHITSQYQKIAVWGAGTKSRSFISLMKDHQPKYVFDSNSVFYRGYLCNSNVQVSQPDKEKINECEVVIIFAISYKNEIKEILRKEYGFQGKIISMDNLEQKEEFES